MGGRVTRINLSLVPSLRALLQCVVVEFIHRVGEPVNLDY
jgi:hypothetical protein